MKTEITIKSILISIAFLLVMSVQPHFAQCPYQDVIGTGFPPNASQIVGIDPAITGNRRTRIEDAFGVWSNGANLPSGNGSQVSFSFPSNPTNPPIQVIQGTPPVLFPGDDPRASAQVGRSGQTGF